MRMNLEMSLFPKERIPFIQSENTSSENNPRPSQYGPLEDELFHLSIFQQSREQWSILLLIGMGIDVR
jgi:hypothetical protein